MMMAAQESRRLDGWSQIAAALSESARIEVSVHSAKRYADRTDDPLPVKRIGRYRKKRIVAEPALVKQWAAREFS